MKSTVVPAQITTVEDKIAGNFTFSQILLLMIPLITCGASFAFLTPAMHMSALKSALMISQACFFGILAIRINGNIVGKWLVLYLGFILRPKRFVFTKNDLYFRQNVHELPEDLVITKEVRAKEVVEKETLSQVEKQSLEKILTDKNIKIRFERAEKGGLNVSLTKV